MTGDMRSPASVSASLRICKTFYLTKRNPHTRKVVSVKLGRFPDLSVQAAWKKAEAEAARIHNGTVRNAMPTVREMLERYIARQTRNGRLSARTAEGTGRWLAAI